MGENTNAQHIVILKGTSSKSSICPLVFSVFTLLSRPISWEGCNGAVDGIEAALSAKQIKHTN